MDYKAALVNGIDSDSKDNSKDISKDNSKDDSKDNSSAVTSYIKSVPVTVQRKPFLQPENDAKLSHTGKSSLMRMKLKP